MIGAVPKAAACGLVVANNKMRVKMNNHNKYSKSQVAIRALLTASVCAYAVSAAAFAADEPENYSIPAGDLKSVLDAFIDQSSDYNEVIYRADQIRGEKSRGLSGEFTSEAALNAILADSGFEYSRDHSGAVVISIGGRRLDGRSRAYRTSALQDQSVQASGDLQGGGRAVESNNAARNGRIDQVVVTASRREQSLQDAPMAITNIDPQSYLDTGLNSIENIIDYSPGVNYNNFGAPGQGQITMRGAPQQSSIPVVGVYVDDVPFSTGSAFSGGAGFIFDGLLGDVERIEILKGPQGTLWGAGAVGGVVRYITRDPALEQARGSLTADFAITEEGGVSKLYNGSVSAPVVKDRIGLTVSGFYRDNAGFIDRVDGTGAVVEEDTNSFETYGISVQTLLRITDDLDIKLGGMVYETKNTALQRSSVTFPGPEPIFGEYKTLIPGEPQSLKYEKLNGTLNYDFGWAEFTSVSAYVSYENELVRDFTTALGALTDTLTMSDPGTHNSVLFFRTLGSEKFVQEARLSSPSNDTLEWQVGLFYTNEDTRNNQIIQPPPTNFNWLNAQFPSEYKELAFFGNATYYLTENWDVTAGVRYSDHELNIDADFSGFLVDATDEESGVKNDVFTYLFTTRYRIGDDLSLYARAATGYRPSFIGLPVVDTDTGEPLADPIVNSDKLRSIEIGAKGGLFDRAVTYDLALWKIDWDQPQSNLSSPLGVGFSANADSDINAFGVEGSFTANPLEGLDIVTNFSYANSEISEADPELQAAEGDATPNLPNWTASLKADYSVPLTSSIDAGLGGGFRYVGSYQTAYSLNPLGVTIPGHILADANATLSYDKLALSLYVTNIFNSFEYTNASISSQRVTVVKPRTVGVAVSLDF